MLKIPHAEMMPRSVIMFWPERHSESLNNKAIIELINANKMHISAKLKNMLMFSTKRSAVRMMLLAISTHEL